MVVIKVSVTEHRYLVLKLIDVILALTDAVSGLPVIQHMGR